MIQEIKAQELKELLDKQEDFQLVDVREDFEYQLVKLPHSTWIPLRHLPERMSELDQNKKTVVLCHHGMRSYQAALYLSEEGFEDVYNLVGGIDAYANEVDNSLPRY